MKQSQLILIRRTQAAAMLGVSTSTLDRWVKDGLIEKPMRLSPKHVGWKEETLRQLVEQGDGK